MSANLINIILFSGPARFICMKPVCPDGFQWYDMKTCAKSMDSAASKADALTSCKGFNPGATLLMPKTENDQQVMENYLQRIGLSNL